MPAAASPRTGTEAVSINLFDPSRLLAVIIVLFWPLRVFPIVLIPALLLATLTIVKHWNDVALDISRLGEFGVVIRLLFGLLVVNVGVRLTLGAIVRAFGGEVRYFRIILLLGIIPRFAIDQTGIAGLDRKGQLWAYGGPLLARLGFFAFGALLWATYRATGSGFPDIALLTSQAGLLAFLFGAVPLLPADGYHWLVTYFRQPGLREKAFLALYAKLTRRPLPPVIRREDMPTLVLFGIGVIVTTVGLALGLLIVVGLVLTARLQGIGALISLALAASFLVWLVRLKSRVAHGRRRPLESALLRTLMASHTASPEPERRPRRRRWPAWAAAVVALILIGLLPYSYEPAGPFEIVPGNRSAATAATAGEVVEIAAREGDRVRAGQVVAQLGSWDQQRDVDLARAQLERARVELAQLEAHQTTDATKAAAASARPAADELEIVAARDEVERLTRQLTRFEDELERTKIRAPADGRVTTPNVQLKTGAWLNAGQVFMQIDDTHMVEAQIEIPQGDVDLVSPGETVRLRSWSERGGEMAGRVSEIAPRAEEQANGDVVRVDASIANPEGLLRPGMRGFAKLEGHEMRVWSACLRLFIRFFTVEIWSWIA